MPMIVVFIDGATSGNPGLSGAGIILKSNDETKEYSIALGVLSNHEAEFHAVLEALKICEKAFPDEILSFQSDSQLVVQAIENQFVKNLLYQPILQMILDKTTSFPHFFIKWIPTNQNKADQLAKQAIHMNT